MKKKAATTIVATAAADGWLQVPCQPFAAPAAPDLPLALCRRLQRRGWAVVHRPSGQVVAHGSTRARAALAAADLLDRRGPARVAAELAALSTAPATAPVAPPRKPLRRAQEGTAPEAVLAAVLRLQPDLDAAEQRAVLGALAGQGRFRGQLLAKCPPVTGPRRNVLAAAAWVGLPPNPWKVPAWSALLLRTEAPAARLLARLLPHRWPAWLDRDAHALQRVGVWG